MRKNLAPDFEWIRDGQPAFPQKVIDAMPPGIHLDVECDDAQCSPVLTTQEFDTQHCTRCNKRFFGNDVPLKHD